MNTHISAIPDVDEYVSFVKEKYGSQKNYNYFVTDLVAALHFSTLYQKPQFITVKTEGKVVGHCALIQDKNLPPGEAFFGFFDSIDDQEVLHKIWYQLVDIAKTNGVRVLKGPVNATAWHQYRALSTSDGSDFFKTELFSESYYSEFFKKQHPQKEIGYHSGYRENVSHITRVTEPAYHLAINRGYNIEEVTRVSSTDLMAILDISKTVFKENWGYTDLTPESFASLYSSQKLSAHLNKIYLLKKESTVIGYLSTLIEDETTLVLKTLAVLPEFHGLGLGNALVYKVHADAQESRYQKILYALIRENNNIKNFPKEDAVVCRRYFTFEFLITV